MTQLRHLACREVYKFLLTLINFVSAVRCASSLACLKIALLLSFCEAKFCKASTRLRLLTFQNHGIFTAFALQGWRKDRLQMGAAYLL